MKWWLQNENLEERWNENSNLKQRNEKQAGRSLTGPCSRHEDDHDDDDNDNDNDKRRKQKAEEL